jgi:hypothetical protein
MAASMIAAMDQHIANDARSSPNRRNPAIFSDALASDVTVTRA